MVKLTQSSWFEYSKKRVLEWMGVAPLSLETRENAILYYYFPEGFARSAPVRYALFYGVQRLQWTGIVSSATEDSFTVRLDQGPFRGFTAIHSFIQDGALTLCDDSFEFQGESSELTSILERASVLYVLNSREKALDILLQVQKEKKTGTFAAIQAPISAG